MADRLLIGHSTAAASPLWNDDDESLHILTLLGMRGRNDQHRMGKFNISRARFRGEGNSSLVLAFEVCFMHTISLFTVARFPSIFHGV